MADPKPMITEGRQAERPVNPFSPAFERELEAHGGNLRKVREALSAGSRRSNMLHGSNTNGFESSSHAPGTPTAVNDLEVGDRIEHNRFGVGVITALSGSGASSKATVEFQNAGTKQLLLKFAKITKIG